MYAINTELEQAVADLVQAVVDIKSRLNQVCDHLREIESHLDTSSMRRMAGDARISVACVEASALTEQLREMASILFGAEEATAEQDECPWRLVWRRIGNVANAIDKVGDALDSYHTTVFENRGAGRGAEAEVDRNTPPVGLDTTRRLLQGCTVAMIQGQWRPTEGLMRKAFEELLPQVMELLHMNGALSRNILGMNERLERRGREVLKRTEGSLERLLPEFEVMLIRVQSCFDFTD